MNWKDIWYICVVGILISSVSMPITRNIEATTINATLGDDTYYNATIEIISNIYKITSVTDNEIILKSSHLPILPSFFRISDANGVQVCNRNGYMNSIVTITGFDGFVKDWLFAGWGFYVIVWGECNKVRVQTFR